MNILFNALFDLTDVYLAVSKNLNKDCSDLNIFWYVSDSQRFDQLISNGIKKDNILSCFDKTPHISQYSDDGIDLIKELSELELRAERSVSMNLFGDRFLNTRNGDKIISEAITQFKEMKEFIKKNKISMVFGEPVNRDALMMALVCEGLNIKYLWPQDARIPHNHFFFQEGVATSGMFSGVACKNDICPEELVNNFRSTPKPPQSYANVMQRLNIYKLLQSLKRRIFRLTKKDKSLVHSSFYMKFIEYLKAFIYSFYLSHIYKYDEVEYKKCKYVYFPLHVQPELSIDVLGPYNNDQFKLISDISRSLPIDTKLIVKEHINFLGQKPIKLFNQIKKLPNSYIIDHRTSSYDLIKNSEFVITISGTAAFEAALMSRWAVVLCDIYFKELPHIKYCSNLSDLKKIYHDIRISKKPNEDEVNQGIQKIIDNYYPGYWVDSYTEPNVMLSNNIIKLSKAFEDILNER